MLNRVKIDLQKAQLRIEALETLICPDGHDWMPAIKEGTYRCSRCYKMKTEPSDGRKKEDK